MLICLKSLIKNKTGGCILTNHYDFYDMTDEEL